MKSFLDSFPRSGRLSPDVSLGARSGGESCPSASAASPPRSNGDRSYCGVRACCDPGDVVWWCVAFFIYLCTRTGKFVTPSRLLFSPLLFFSSRCFGSSSSSSTSGPSLLMVGGGHFRIFFYSWQFPCRRNRRRSYFSPASTYSRCGGCQWVLSRLSGALTLATKKRSV